MILVFHFSVRFVHVLSVLFISVIVLIGFLHVALLLVRCGLLSIASCRCMLYRSSILEPVGGRFEVGVELSSNFHYDMTTCFATGRSKELTPRVLVFVNCFRNPNFHNSLNPCSFSFLFVFLAVRDVVFSEFCYS